MLYLSRIITVSLLALSYCSILNAANRDWDGDENNNLSDSDNWVQEASPSGHDWKFPSGASSTTPVSDSALTANSITFEASAASFTISGASLITLSGALKNSSTNTQEISAPIATTTTHDFDASSGNIVLSGNLSGTGGLLVKGGNSVKLSGSASTYSGTTEVDSSSTLILGHSNALGSTSSTTLKSGTLVIDTAGVDISEAITSNSVNDNILGGTNTTGTTTFSGAITIDKDIQLTAASGGTTTFSAAIGESSATKDLTKVGAGTVIVGGTNTYTGVTLVSAGTLLVDGSIHATSATTVNSGATLGGSGTLNGTMTLNNGGIITGGGYNSVGNLTLGNATNTLSAGSTIYVEFNDAGGPSGTYDGTAGTHWDLLSFSSTHTLADTSADPIVIKIRNETAGFFTSLEGLPSFADSPNYGGTGKDFKIVDNVTGYNASYFSLDSDILNINWSLVHDSNALWLSFQAVPEPSTYVMGGMLVVLIVTGFIRRRMKNGKRC